MANNCKFELKQYQVSYNGGISWQDVVPNQFEKGDLIEYDSQDCAEIETQYRWRTLDGQYICDGDEKWTKQIQEESYNNGATWYTSYPTVYQKGTYVGIDSDFCNEKFIGHYVLTGNTSFGICSSGYIWDGYECVYVHQYVDPLKVVKCNDNATLTNSETKYYTSGYTLISAEIGDCVTSIGVSAFDACTTLSSVTISNTVTSIDSHAFFSCFRLTSIDIPNSVTSIGNSAFYGCRSLTSCTIGSGVTSIGNMAFQSCSGLTSIDLPSGITYIDYWAFKECRRLSSVTVNAVTPPTLGGDAFGVTDDNLKIYVPCESVGTYKAASGWSSYASRIRAIEPSCSRKIDATFTSGRTDYINCNDSPLSSGDTRSMAYPYSAMTSAVIGDCVTNISADAFSNCTSLTSIDIPNSVSYIGTNAFCSCVNLTSCTTFSNVIAIDSYAFNRCYKLASIVMPNTVTSIGIGAFMDCHSLTSVTIPSGITSISNSTFERCSALTSVSIPNTVTTIKNYAFDGCSSLTSIDIPSGLTEISDGVFQGCNSLKRVNSSVDGVCNISSGITNINIQAFYGCSSLSSINIPNSVTRIGQWAFRDCSSLISITVNATTPPTLGTRPFANTNNCSIYVPCESVDAYKTASEWSYYASRIVGIPPCGEPLASKFYANYSNGTSYSAACDSTSGLTTATTRAHSTSYTAMTSAVIGSCVTSIGNNAFSGCSSLSSCTIGSGVTSISTYAFSNCTSLTSIGAIGSGASVEIPSGVTSIGISAFLWCTSLSSITIPNSVTSIGNFVFSNCSGLTNCTIGSGVTSIGDGAFNWCTSLTSCTLPNTVTSIGNLAFDACRSLTNIDIPSGVTSIGAEAFESCTSLTSVTVLATTPPTLGKLGGSYDTFTNTNDCPIYVPSGSVDTYKAANGWRNYASRIQAIPNS